MANMYALPQPAAPQLQPPAVPYEVHRSQVGDLVYPLAPECEQLSPLKNIWRRNSWPQPLVPPSDTNSSRKCGWESLRAWGQQKGEGKGLA